MDSVGSLDMYVHNLNCKIGTPNLVRADSLAENQKMLSPMSLSILEAHPCQTATFLIRNNILDHYKILVYNTSTLILSKMHDKFEASLYSCTPLLYIKLFNCA